MIIYDYKLHVRFFPFLIYLNQLTTEPSNDVGNNCAGPYITDKFCLV